ncbi:hypothetical protein HK405_009813 [Cladochytrium tenue]|nr:hypothetical protein HK405_009813 [Cladochytrium tenue]
MERPQILASKHSYNFMIVFIAGHENVQQCLTSLLYLLAIHQDVQERCRQEACSILGTGGTAASWTANDVARMTYAFKVVRETIRLLPPIPQLANRRASSSTGDKSDYVALDDVMVPSGTYVAWHAFGLHHNPAVWNDPEAFDPERWTDKGKGQSEAGQLAEDPFGFIGFAGGIRQCRFNTLGGHRTDNRRLSGLGQRLAIMEVLTFLATMLLKYRWSLPPGRDFQMTPAGILAPVGLELDIQEILA